MVTFNQNGYIGCSMSVRAKEAYSNGEMPLSKWTKTAIIDEIEEENQSLADYIKVKELTLKELRSEFLEYSSWHHVGPCAKVTDFYAMADVSEYSLADIDRIIENRAPRKMKKARAPKPQPKYVTALVNYEVWRKSYSHFCKVKGQSIIRYMEGEKMVSTLDGMKRLSGLSEVVRVVQKTKFASDQKIIALAKKGGIKVKIGNI